MRKTWTCWLVAVIVTIVSAFWQRATGPSHPVSGSVTIGGLTIGLKLDRSHSIDSDQPVRVTVGDPAVTGEVVWRRYPTHDEWTALPLVREGDVLAGHLPRQPAAGKLAYQVRLRKGGDEALFPPRPAVTRFRGDVPPWVLIPHILAMFVGMLLAARAGMEALAARPRVKQLSWATLWVILIGGFVLGPLVLHYAFGEWWGGFPFGTDLTDNKTLVGGLVWVIAVWCLRGGRAARGAVIAAAVVTLLVFAIPHSVWGSELKWERAPGAARTPSAAGLPSPAAQPRATPGSNQAPLPPH